jgi:deoxyribodipyrimidine photo-lyase
LAAAPEVTSERLDDWQLEPTKPDWAGGLRATWTPGEAGTRTRLKHFLQKRIAGYASRRDRPDDEATSRLSPHLRFGEISPFQVWHAAQFVAEKDQRVRRDIEKFLSELGWREFSYHLLHGFPDLASRNLQDRFDTFPWASNASALRAWQRGLTGYPIVDAGMRQLWQTGWMHNRVRMVVASFLIKHLLINWTEGERWFWDTLVDADPANNPASWQWVAAAALTLRPISASSTRFCRARSSIRMAAMCANSCRNWQGFPMRSCTSPGPRRRCCCGRRGSRSAKRIRSPLSTMRRRASARSQPSRD